jgi:hypothetical protein
MPECVWLATAGWLGEACCARCGAVKSQRVTSRIACAPTASGKPDPPLWREQALALLTSIPLKLAPFGTGNSFSAGMILTYFAKDFALRQ